MNWAKDLVSWYQKNKRSLPWRDVSNPYYTWLSEVILQQTRVAQAIPYFYRFIEEYPTIHDLSKASESNILMLWQGLGYYSRGRNLHKAAQIWVEQYGGNFNLSIKELQSLPGIGSYTAAAIASIAFEHPVPVIDGNVYRVVSRLLCITEPVPSKKAEQLFYEVLLDAMQGLKPSEFNQGLMELGALVCKPQNPQCNTCPLKLHCRAYSENTVMQFPVKIKKAAVKPLYFHYLFCTEPAQDKTLIYRRSEGIWKGLYEFPVLQTQGPSLNEAELCKYLGLDLEEDVLHIEQDWRADHKLTHRLIHAFFWKIEVKNLGLLKNKSIFEIQLEELISFPTHQLMKKYLKTLLPTAHD